MPDLDLAPIKHRRRVAIATVLVSAGMRTMSMIGEAAGACAASSADVDNLVAEIERLRSKTDDTAYEVGLWMRRHGEALDQAADAKALAADYAEKIRRRDEEREECEQRGALWREHSVTLNTVSYSIAEAIGRVTRPEDYVGDVEVDLGVLIDRLTRQRSYTRALMDIAVEALNNVDDVPTAKRLRGALTALAADGA